MQPGAFVVYALASDDFVVLFHLLELVAIPRAADSDGESTVPPALRIVDFDAHRIRPEIAVIDEHAVRKPGILRMLGASPEGEAARVREREQKLFVRPSVPQKSAIEDPRQPERRPQHVRNARHAFRAPPRSAQMKLFHGTSYRLEKRPCTLAKSRSGVNSL